MNSAFSSVIGFPCLPILPWHSMLLSRRSHQSRWILPAQLDEDLVEPKSRVYPVLVVVDDCNAREKNSLRVAPSLIYRLDSREFDADLSFHLDKDRKVGLKSYSSLKGCPIWHLSYWSADLLPGYRYYCDPVTICHRIRGGFSIL
ncbi:unnamed protein product [Musa acuminata var. zebrina]